METEDSPADKITDLFQTKVREIDTFIRNMSSREAVIHFSKPKNIFDQKAEEFDKETAIYGLEKGTFFPGVRRFYPQVMALYDSMKKIRLDDLKSRRAQGRERF